MLPAAAFLLLALGAPAASVAVIDLSTTSQGAFVEALRKAPGVKGRALPSARTSAVVEDAKGLGLDCRVSDDKCLEKLMVLLRADELIAFAFERGSVRLVRMADGQTQRARVKFSAPATTARAAMAALADAGTPAPERASPAAARDGAPPDGAAALEPIRPEGQQDAVPERAEAPAPATSLVGAAGAGGVSPALAIGIVGGSVGLGCGVIAIGVSLDLAQQQLDAKDPALRRPIDGGAYDRGLLTFGALTTCALAGLVTAGVGVGLFVSEAAPAEQPEGVENVRGDG